MLSNSKKDLRTKVRSVSDMLPTPVLRLGFKHRLGFIDFSHALLNRTLYLFLFLVSFNFFSCGNTPEPINYGKDECEHCRMMITDNKYGAEAVTDKGKILKFDSIECLIEYALEKNMVGDASQSFLVTDFSKPPELIDAKTAFFVHNSNFRSPMELNVSALGSEKELTSFLTLNGGRKLSWVEVIELVKQSIM